MRSGLRRLFALSVTLVSGGAQALEIERAEAQFADKRFSFELIATLDAPIDRIDAVLKDYAGYPALDARILESRVLERPAPDEVMLFTSLRACFGPFCRSVKRVERVQEHVHELHASTLAEQSDVTYGETFTQLSNAGQRTRVIYRTTVSPDFWIPRFVGRRLMLNTLRDATLNMFGNIEKRAAEVPQEAATLPSEPVVLPH